MLDELVRTRSWEKRGGSSGGGSLACEWQSESFETRRTTWLHSALRCNLNLELEAMVPTSHWFIAISTVSLLLHSCDHEPCFVFNGILAVKHLPSRLSNPGDAPTTVQDGSICALTLWRRAAKRPAIVYSDRSQTALTRTRMRPPPRQPLSSQWVVYIGTPSGPPSLLFLPISLRQPGA
jgi:hypothetical protein